MPTVAKTKDVAKAAGRTTRFDVKSAVQIAMRSFLDLFPQLVNSGVMLEEIEPANDGGSWLITIGYDTKRLLSGHQRMFQPEVYRAYKTFKIDSRTGAVESVKIKSVA